MTQTTDALQAAQGKVVKVGIGQIDNPTPMAAKWIFRLFTFFSGLWAILAPSITEIDHDIIAKVDRYLLIGVAVMHYAIKFFGWDYKDKSEQNY